MSDRPSLPDYPSPREIAGFFVRYGCAIYILVMTLAVIWLAYGKYRAIDCEKLFQELEMG
jgi:hypothetical protein